MSSIKKFLQMCRGYSLMHSVSPNNHQITLLLILRKIKHVVLVVKQLFCGFLNEKLHARVPMYTKNSKKNYQNYPSEHFHTEKNYPNLLI